MSEEAEAQAEEEPVDKIQGSPLEIIGAQSVLQNCLGIASATEQISVEVMDLTLEMLEADRREMVVKGAPNEVLSQLELHRDVIKAVRHLNRRLAELGDKHKARQSLGL